MLLKLLKFSAGMALGFALWAGMQPAYLELLAREAAIIRIDRRYADIEMITRGRALFVRSATGVFPPITLPADELTYNVILVFALFAINDGTFTTRNMKRFALALLIVLVLHPVGLLISTEATYATRVPPWSEKHYGDIAANVWSALETFWRLVGMFGVVFAVWWALSPASVSRRS
jgi:hypothetical protein